MTARAKTVLEVLERTGGRSGEAALWATIMHTVARGLQGPSRVGPLSKLDVVYDRQSNSLSPAAKDILKGLVDAYFEIPVERLKPMTGVSLSRRRIDETMTNQVLRESRIASKILDGAMRRVTVLGISEVLPESPKGYVLGQEIQISGGFFDKSLAKNKIIFGGYFFPPDQKAYGELPPVSPTKATTTLLTTNVPTWDQIVQLNNSLGLAYPPSHPVYMTVRVELESGRSTEKVEFKEFQEPYTVPATPKPVITAFTPPSCLAGQSVIVTGSNLPGGSGGVFEFTPLNPPRPTFTKWIDSEFISSTQVRLNLPPLMEPGMYQVQVPPSNYEYSTQSDIYFFEVRPFRYKADFLTIHCIDESDSPVEDLPFVPDEAGDDEIYTEWMIASDDGQVWTKKSSLYDGFDDGTIMSYNSTDMSVFHVSGNPHPVTQALAIVTSLKETEETDVKAGQKALDVIAGLALVVAELAVAAQNVLVAAIAAATATVIEIFNKIYPNLFGGEQSLGTQTRLWRADQLYNITNNPERRFAGTLPFPNSDNVGSYEVAYEIRRMSD